MVGIDERSPLYVFTEEGFKSQDEIEQAAVEAGRRLATPTLGSPWFCLSLVGALLAWFFDTTGTFELAERYLERRQQYLAVEPYRMWAQNHPLSYDEVASNPSGYTGKSVSWIITAGVGGDFYFCSDIDKKVAWTDVRALSGLQTDRPFKILARIEGSDMDFPLLMFLGEL